MKGAAFLYLLAMLAGLAVVNGLIIGLGGGASWAFFWVVILAVNPLVLGLAAYQDGKHGFKRITWGVLALLTAAWLISYYTSYERIFGMPLWETRGLGHRRYTGGMIWIAPGYAVAIWGIFTAAFRTGQAFSKDPQRRRKADDGMFKSR